MINLGHCDISVSAGCNKSCRDCSHISPILKPWFLLPASLERDLAAIKPIVHFKVLQMVGGEPTLNPRLVECIHVARASGVANEVCVITNGELLERMTPEFWKAIDYLQLSIYPTLEEEMVSYARRKCEEHGKPFFSTRFTDFYQQFRSPMNNGDHFNGCHWRTECHQIHDGHFALCPQSLFMPKQFMGLPEFVDALPLEGLTEEKFLAFFNRTEPLNACRMCMANELKSKPWAEPSRKNWEAESRAP